MKINRRVLLAGIATFSLSPAKSYFRGIASAHWEQVKLGGGGQLTDIDIVGFSGQPYKICRADAFGVYRKYPTDFKWVLLMNSTSGLPSGGGWEARIAPSNPNRIWIGAGGFHWYSTNAGRTFTKSDLPQDTGSNYGSNNSSTKFIQNKYAIDPNNELHGFAWLTTGGLYETTNGGVNWSLVSAVTAASSLGGSVCFDPNSGTTGGNTNIVYVCSFGNGVWRTTNGSSASFTQISDGAGLGGPTVAYTSGVGRSGVYWTSNSYQAGPTPGGDFKWSAGSWGTTGLTSTHGVIPSPTVSGLVVFNGGGCIMRISTDDGSTYIGGTAFALNNPIGNGACNPTDIPWLQASVASTPPGSPFLFCPNNRFDPVTGNLYMASGVGIFWVTLPSTFSAMTMTSETLGIEELVAVDVISPPGSSTVHFAVEDRGAFSITDFSQYPSRYGVTNTVFGYGFGIDYASNAPKTICLVKNFNGPTDSGITTNAGGSWTPYASQAPASSPGNLGGCISAASAQNQIWAPSNNGVPFYTLDGGGTWTKCPGLPSDGWPFSIFDLGYMVAADRVNFNSGGPGIGTHYLYNFGPTNPGIFKTTDGGKNWAQPFVGNVAGFGASGGMRLRCAPGNAGHLWFCAGALFYGTASKLQYAIDTGGTLTFITIANVDAVMDFGFGAIAAGATYPTIYMIGRVSSVAGIWSSTDMGTTWKKLASGAWVPVSNDNSFQIDLGIGNAARLQTITGDGNTIGSCYVGTGGGAGFFRLVA